MTHIPEVEDLILEELERKYNTTGMKRIFLKIKEFIDDARTSGYLLPEWDAEIEL